MVVSHPHSLEHYCQHNKDDNIHKSVAQQIRRLDKRTIKIYKMNAFNIHHYLEVGPTLIMEKLRFK